MYPILIPLLLNMTVNTKKFREKWTMLGAIEDKLSKTFEPKLVKSILAIIRLGMIVTSIAGLVILIFTYKVVWPPGQDALIAPCPPEKALLSFTIFVSFILMSVPAWQNFAMVSGYQWLRNKSFELRGYADYSGMRYIQYELYTGAITI